jgi:hypothetical protein
MWLCVTGTSLVLLSTRQREALLPSLQPGTGTQASSLGAWGSRVPQSSRDTGSWREPEKNAMSKQPRVLPLEGSLPRL